MSNPRKAWIFQHDNGSWYVGWYDPATGRKRKKSMGPRKTDANNFAAKKTAALVAGLSGDAGQKSWAEFREQATDTFTKLSAGTRSEYELCLNHYERLLKPKQIKDVTNQAINRYVSKRANEPGGKAGSTTSSATINKELRGLKKLFRLAKKWKYIPEELEIEFLREAHVEPTFISEEQFVALYQACDAATSPKLPGVDTADWWRAYLTFAYLTGWRMSEPLALLWADVDLAAGYAITRAGDNKGRREARVPLADVVIEHLAKIKSESLEVFPWPSHRTRMNSQLNRIQAKAGIKKICRKDHPHDEVCERFGFHDLRRGFATANAASLSASQLQTMMRHSSYATTQKYIHMGEQSNRDDVVAKLRTPNLGQSPKMGGAS